MYVIIWRGVGQVFLPLDPCKAFLGPVSYPVEIQAAGRAETCCCHSLLAAPPVGLFLTRSFARQCPGRCHTCQWLTPTQATSQSCIESSYITPWDCSYSTDSPVYCVSIAVPRPTKECIQFIWYWGWQSGKLCTCTGTSSKNKHGVCWPLLLQSCWEKRQRGAEHGWRSCDRSNFRMTWSHWVIWKYADAPCVHSAGPQRSQKHHPVTEHWTSTTVQWISRITTK